jgi:F-type H+-transporting ATPase subunit gamma
MMSVSMRLKAISNIGKITKSMKMIASTKVTKAQKNMEVARAYGSTANGKSADGVVLILYSI